MKSKLYSVFNSTEEIHWWFMGRRRIILSLIAGLLSPRNGYRILDVGCGTGATLKKLEEYGEAIGIDISEEAVRFSRQRGCRDVRLTGGDEIPFPDQSFDCVVALDVIEHIDDDGKALRDYRRVLKSGSRLVLTVPAYRWLWSCHDDDNQHRRRYTRRLLKEKLRSSGLIIERLSYFSTFLFPLIASVRLAVKILDRSFHIRKKGLDFRIPARPGNRFLYRVFSAEAFWLRWGNLPFGSSLLAVCRKIEE